MKVRVIVSTFKDKTTGCYHSKGDVIDVSKERYEEITEKGKFVEPVKGKAKAADSADDKQDEESPAEEPEPSSMSPPLHAYEGVAYEEMPLKSNNVQSRAKEDNER